MSARSRSKIIRRTNVVIGRALPKAGSKWTAANGGATLATWQRLDCPVPRQEQSNWCWCATTLGVHKFYKILDLTSQCDAANIILQRLDACTKPGDPEINKVYFLDKALAALGHLRAPIITGVLTFSQVAIEITLKTPLCTRIGWAGGGGHFMAVEGVLAGVTPRLAINDPIDGRTEIDYSLYLSAYQGSGSWTHSYMTN